MIENTGNVLLTIGVVVIFFAALAVVRFPDVYSRVSAFVKLACFGMFCLMLAIFILEGFSATALKAFILCALAAAMLPAGVQALLKVSRSAGVPDSDEEVKDSK